MKDKSDYFEKYDKLYDGLWGIVKELENYYIIDKVKNWAVYIHSKTPDYYYKENLFDIEANKIIYYVENCEIIEEDLPVIRRVQDKLNEIKEFFENEKQIK